MKTIEFLQQRINELEATSQGLALPKIARRIQRHQITLAGSVRLKRGGCVEEVSHSLHRSGPEVRPGPMEAVRDFLNTTSSFKADATRERYLMTLNPSGYLRKS